MVDLDSSNNIVFKQLLSPIPEELRIPNLSQNSVNTRAETFLIPGNVFYYLSILNDKYLTERIIIKSRRALDSDNGLIVIKVNDSDGPNPSNCTSKSNQLFCEYVNVLHNSNIEIKKFFNIVFEYF